MEPPPAARSLAVVALVLASALLASGQLPGLPRSSGASGVVVGDLKLADRDEGPSDGVEGTFQSEDMAPGDTYRSRLTLVRESPTGLPPVLQPQATIQLNETGSSSALARALAVDVLRYGGDSRLAEARQGCGTPLTIARLAACTHSPANPLANLSDPTPDGKDLELGVRFTDDAGSGFEGERWGFEVHAELSGRAPVEDPTRSADEDRQVPREEPAPGCREPSDEGALEGAVSARVDEEELAVDPLGGTLDGIDVDRLLGAGLPYGC